MICGKERGKMVTERLPHLTFSFANSGMLSQLDQRRRPDQAVHATSRQGAGRPPTDERYIDK